MSASVVPARAGMSPDDAAHHHLRHRGPRASGDEPQIIGSIAAELLWSPRERG